MTFEAIANVYNHLQDKESHTIFEKRLLFSLTGDKSYIREMIFEVSKIEQVARCGGGG